jgi:hypothetical protein
MLTELERTTSEEEDTEFSTDEEAHYADDMVTQTEATSSDLSSDNADMNKRYREYVPPR